MGGWRNRSFRVLVGFDLFVTSKTLVGGFLFLKKVIFKMPNNQLIVSKMLFIPINTN